MALVAHEEALGRVLGRIRELPRTPEVSLAPVDAVGLVVSEDVVCGEPVPPFDNSAVDGFAVRSDDLRELPVVLDVLETIAAGTAPRSGIPGGCCARIMTGAVMPPGADAVVMVEDTRAAGDSVEVLSAVGPGEHVRPTGDDLQRGDVAVARGTVLRPAHVGLLATVGRTAVRVASRPRVGVMSTGDELVAPGDPLGPGQIRDSNREMLLALCAAAGFVPVDLGLVRDDEAGIEAALSQGARDCDALVTSGGVSMGEFDYVKAVLARIADMEWMQVAVKPAKPFAFGVLDGVPVFGLPGNPVSSLVSFELFARPGLLALCGHERVTRVTVPAVAGGAIGRRADGKVHYVRVRLHDDGAGLVATPTGAQGSHQLGASASAQGLAVVPDGEGVPAGAPVRVIPLDPGI